MVHAPVMQADWSSLTLRGWKQTCRRSWHVGRDARWQQGRALIARLSLVTMFILVILCFCQCCRGIWCLVIFKSFFLTLSVGAPSKSCCAPTNTSTLVLKNMLSLSFPFISFCLAALHHMIWVQINHNGLCESCFSWRPVLESTSRSF